MRKMFATKTGLVFAISFVAFAATGSLPALAQSASAFGSPLPNLSRRRRRARAGMVSANSERSAARPCAANQ